MSSRPDVAAAVLTHPDGGLKGIPRSARVIVAITKVGPASEAAAAAVVELVGPDPRIDRVVDGAIRSGLRPLRRLALKRLCGRPNLLV